MVDINANIDYYAVLGVPHNVMPDTLRQAYRDLAKMYHPDAVDGDAGKFRQIQEAYNVLSDAVYRRTYDKLRETRGYTPSTFAPIAFELSQNRQELPILDTQQVFYLFLDFHSEETHKVSRQKLNISLVIDCSNSMRGSRIHNVKMAATDLLNVLRDDDYLSIISFNDRAIVEAPAATVGNKRVFQSAIAALSTGGGTEIHQGLLAGYGEAELYKSENTISHVILLTDGRTYGDEESALSLVEKACRQGVGLSAFGIGEDWNDAFLDKLSQNGGGVSQYIESPIDIRKFLSDRIQNLSQLVARHLQIQVNTVPYVHIQSVYRALPHMESIPMSHGNVVMIGEVPAGETSVLVFTVIVDNNQEEMGRRRVLRLDVQAERLDTLKSFSLSRDVYISFSNQPAEEQIPSRLFNILSRLSVYQLQEKAWDAMEMDKPETATKYLDAAATQLFNLGYPALANAAIIESNRLATGDSVTTKGRKQIRYGTRSLSLTDSTPGGVNGTEGH